MLRRIPNVCLILMLIQPLALVQAQSWQLVWQDEFNGNAIDPAKWEHEVNGNGGGNNELQYYTARDTNSYVENGRLIIRALKETYTGNDGTREYTSARMRTQHRGDWMYGRVEVRAKLPAGTGTWPAIWMLPTDWVYGGWPNSGEIDIMEHVGYDPGIVHGTIHTQAYNHISGTQVGNHVSVPDFDTNFHVYSLEWTPLQIRVYVDNNHYFTFDNENQGWQKWPFDQRFHLLLNIAIGGNWGGVQGVDDSIFPVQMEIDYVRVYQDTNAAPSINISNPLPGSSFQAGDSIIIDVDADDPGGTVQSVEFYQGDTKIGQDDTAPFQNVVPDAYGGCYTLTAKATDASGYTSITPPTEITVGSGCGKSPYTITPGQIPGIIEAENFDTGGAGISYHDADAQNNGDNFRQTEGVDIESTSDLGGGYNLGWIEAGEWVEYIVNVRYSGMYSIISRVASPGGGGAFVIEMDGIAVTPTVVVNATGGWQNWQSLFTDNVPLNRGVQVMRIRVVNGGFNLNKLTIFSVAVGTEPDPGNPQPTRFSLAQNYPNPFNPATTIRYSIPENDRVRLVVYDLVGREVATLVDERQPMGNYEIVFDATPLNSGSYFFRLSTSQHSAIGKMLLVR